MNILSALIEHYMHMEWMWIVVRKQDEEIVRRV